PASAGFRRWLAGRPSARQAFSAVSSARTIGLDDPELSFQQLELESRRGVTGDGAAEAVEAHYDAVCERSVGRTESPGKSKGSSRSPSRSRSKSGGSRRKTKNNSGSRSGSRSRFGSASPRRGANAKAKARGSKTAGRGKGSVATLLLPPPSPPRPAVLPARAAAAAFVARRFPDATRPASSLLGREQADEVAAVLAAFAREGLPPVQPAMLRRGLLVPEDRPVEQCWAGMRAPLEGLADLPAP
ncbi:unnamed protein product, partial [Phaeothamnion confervicola]